MQCACAILFCRLWPVLLYHIFPHNLTKDTIFEKKKKRITEHNMCFGFFPQLSCESFLILIIIQRGIIINICWSFTSSTHYSFQILVKILLFWQIFFNTKIWNFMIIHPMRQELFHAVRQTYMTKLIVAFCNFVNGPKTSSAGAYSHLLCVFCLTDGRNTRTV
jgi:hypothetical protein